MSNNISSMISQSIFSSKNFKRAEINLQGKLSNSFLKTYPHCVVPGYNLNKFSYIEDGRSEDVVEMYQEFPFNCDLPKPILPPAKLPRSVFHGNDPATDLLSFKSVVNDDIDRIMEYQQKYKNDFEPIHKGSVKWKRNKKITSTEIPKYVADIAEVIDRDPDPDFRGKYNWYYTGGTVQSVKMGNNNILIFPYMDELVAAPVVSTGNTLWKPILARAAKWKLDGILYEIRVTVSNNICTILGRYKNYCHIYKLTEAGNKLKLEKEQCTLSEPPISGIDMNIFNSNEYCIVDVNRLITVWDKTKENCILSGSVSKNNNELSDSWGSIKYHSQNSNLLIFTDRHCVQYIDTRVSFKTSVLKLCPKQNLDDCDDLCFNIPSCNSPYRYLGTYHSLLMYDERSVDECVQQKWTHQFKSAPLLVSTCKREDKEFIVITSQIAGESSIIVNTWTSDDTFHSYNLPYSPPTILQTLYQCQIQGNCLNPHLKNRLELSNIGSTLILNDNNIMLFSQNSIGDIFYQCITHEEPLENYGVENNESYRALVSWENAFLKQCNLITPLSISTKCNLRDAYKMLTNKNLKLNKNDAKTESELYPSWKQSTEKLKSYVDVLAPELLAAWELQEEGPTSTAVAPHMKVLDWLESADTTHLTQTQDEFQYNGTPVNTQELISVSQEYNIDDMTDSFALQELLLPKVKSKPLKKKSRR